MMSKVIILTITTLNGHFLTSNFLPHFRHLRPSDLKVRPQLHLKCKYVLTNNYFNYSYNITFRLLHN